MCPGGSRSSLTQRALDEERCGFQGGLVPDLCQETVHKQEAAVMTSREAHELCRVQSRIRHRRGEGQDPGRGGHYVGTATQPKHLEGDRKSVPARETPTAGETAKCAVNSDVRTSTKGSEGRSRREATATSKHVGTTLRKNEGVARRVADRAWRNTHKTFHKASRWGYSRAATGRGAGNVLRAACTSTERSKRV